MFPSCRTFKPDFTFYIRPLVWETISKDVQNENEIALARCQLLLGDVDRA